MRCVLQECIDYVKKQIRRNSSGAIILNLQKRIYVRTYVHNHSQALAFTFTTNDTRLSRGNYEYMTWTKRQHIYGQTLNEHISFILALALFHIYNIYNFIWPESNALWTCCAVHSSPFLALFRFDHQYYHIVSINWVWLASRERFTNCCPFRLRLLHSSD